MANRAGVICGADTPRVFCNPKRRMYMVVHGDVFIVLGHDGNLDWFREHIAKEWECKFKARLGPNPEDDKCTRVLNRVVE